MTPMPASPFCESVAIPVAEGPVAASCHASAPHEAAAGLASVSPGGDPSTGEGMPSTTAFLPGEADCISELFHHARNLVPLPGLQISRAGHQLDEARFMRNIVDPPEIFQPGSSKKLLALLKELADQDPPPLFLQERRTA